MGIGETLSPATNILKGGATKLAGFWWVLLIFVGIAIVVAIVVLIKMYKDKNAQWTHRLIVRRVLQNGLLSKPIEHKMRRFPLIKRAEVFELEKSLLGGYLMPELDEYSGVNEYSIVIDNNNRIYINKGEYFDPDKSSVNVSAKHAEIDISRSDLRADFQNINKVNKRVEWGQIAKFAMISLLIIATMIVLIVGFGEWGEAQKEKTKTAQAEAQTFENLAKALETSEATANTQVIILDKLIEITGNKNIQSEIREAKT